MILIRFLRFSRDSQPSHSSLTGDAWKILRDRPYSWTFLGIGQNDGSNNPTLITSDWTVGSICRIKCRVVWYYPAVRRSIVWNAIPDRNRRGSWTVLKRVLGTRWRSPGRRWSSKWTRSDRWPGSTLGRSPDHRSTLSSLQMLGSISVRVSQSVARCSYLTDFQGSPTTIYNSKSTAFSHQLSEQTRSKIKFNSRAVLEQIQTKFRAIVEQF